jgi:hypothetical protein
LLSRIEARFSGTRAGRVRTMNNTSVEAAIGAVVIVVAAAFFVFL